MRVHVQMAVALALLVSGCGTGGDSDSDAASDPAASTMPAPVVVEQPAEQCSASGAATQSLALPDQDGLPPAVDDTRRELFDAALACDFGELAELAGEDFSYTFGVADPTGPASYWRQVDDQERVMDTLARVLTTPHARDAAGDDASYVWPSAHVDKPTDADWDALVDAEVIAGDDLPVLRSVGSYLGYRTAITPDGTWQYFIAGD